MQASDAPFLNIIQGNKQYIIPVFQRDYDWTEEQCQQLFTDILAVADSDTGSGHFIGSVVYIATDGNSGSFGRWLLIDGQQRVTTLSLLLAAMRDHIAKTGWVGGDDSPTAEEIDSSYLRNLHAKGEKQNKLILRRHDQATLAAIISKEDEPPSPKSERVSENYDYFRQALKDSELDAVYRGIGRLILVDVTLTRGKDDPQLIFESLNSTGKDLSQADLIRNFILMRVDEEEQTMLYEKYWSKIENLFRKSGKAFDAFARDFIALKTKARKQEKADEVYLAFRRVFPDLQHSLGGLEGVLAEMYRFARYHAAFSLNANGFPGIAAELASVRKLVDVPATLVMQLFDCYERLKTLTLVDFREALRLIESYVFRRAICGEQTRGYWAVFAGLANDLNTTKPLTSLKVRLHRNSDGYRFPSDAEFKKAMLEKDLFGLRVCKFMLDRMENFDTKEPSTTSDYSIEHIMPQNKKLSADWRQMLGDDWEAVHQTWLHRLGNLTLTGYNQKYSDKPFVDKKTMEHGFRDSAVRLNKMVRDQTAWSATEMEHRGESLAELALKIWPSSVVDEADLEAAEAEELQKRASRKDVADVPMSEKARAIYEALRPRILEIAPDAIEIAEPKSISFHNPGFFVELLPRTHRVLLLLPPDFSEINDDSGLAIDATGRKFFANAKYEGGTVVRVNELADIDSSVGIIRQSLLLVAP